MSTTIGCQIPGVSQPKEPVRLIDADEVMNAVFNAIDIDEKQWNEIKQEVDEIPSIDPETLRPTAHWVETGEYVQTIDAVKIPVKICSGCHMDIALEEFESYCPHCGARMVNGDD